MRDQRQTNEHTTMSRRELLGGAAAVAALAMAPSMLRTAAGQPAAKPDSKFNGVQIGTITYSFRDLPGTAEDLLKYTVQAGISSIELMAEPAEQFAGIPGGPQAKDWRLSAPMDKFQALRKLYNDAGVSIHIVKFGNIGEGNMSDGEIDYCFKVAKALGANGITREISEDAAKRLAPFADKHQIMIGFHNHTQMTPTTYEGPILSYSKYLGINFDIGHYVAGTNQCPMDIIRKYHDRILSLHLKNRKVNNGPNMPFGQGDTPVALVLLMLKREKWTFPADIELE
ncbi:MAG: sugar phosphate isomerase/epimerase family protein, partial [Solirubrobacterales bacterium]